MVGLMIDPEIYITVSKTFGMYLGDGQYDCVFDYHYPSEGKEERKILKIAPSEGIVIRYLAMRLNCMEYNEDMKIDIHIPDEHVKLFKSKLLKDAVNDINSFNMVIDYMQKMELPAVLNFYGDKYGQDVVDELLKQGEGDPYGLWNGVAYFCQMEKPLESYEQSELAKYIWKTVAELTI